MTTTRRVAARGRTGLLIAAGLALACLLSACGSSSKAASSPAGAVGSPTAAASLLKTALAELEQGDTAQAQASFEQVTKIDPRNQFAYYNLGYILQSQHKLAAAQLQYRLAIAVDPNYDLALYNLGIASAASGDVPGAIKAYEQAIAANPKDAGAHYNLGLLLRRTGHTAASNTQLLIAVKLKPAYAEAAAAQGVPGIKK